MNKQQLEAAIQAKKSFLCVGLDPDLTKTPSPLKGHPEEMLAFNKAIIDATKDHCVAYKINTAFYECLGYEGWRILEKTLEYIPEGYFTIADAKRGDIGNTSAQYAKAFFEFYDFDAITVAPYMGEDSLRPFLEYENKFTIVLGLTSNKGANDFEMLSVQENGEPAQRLYEKVLTKVSKWGNPNNLMFVVGATQATELEHIRKIVPDNFLLVPGVGAQGGSLQDVAKYGKNKNCGLLVNVSRAILYAGDGEDFAQKAATAALEYQKEMGQLL